MLQYEECKTRIVQQSQNRHKKSAKQALFSKVKFAVKKSAKKVLFNKVNCFLSTNFQFIFKYIFILHDPYLHTSEIANNEA